MKILLGSPVYQKPEILSFFLGSLSKLISTNFTLHFLFIDDNNSKYILSSNLLTQFSNQFPGKVNIIKGDIVSDEYKTHQWHESIVWKVASYKNKIIEYSIANDYDFLFLVDSDLVLHPDTIQHLINQNKNIISEIYWTKWNINDSSDLPQVWLSDKYTLHNDQISETEFINQLRIPGVYEVGGLGACTLISKYALNMGVNFSKIHNLTIWGEDRHFCIRAVCLGLKLWVDTTYPAFHIYRDADLQSLILAKNTNIFGDMSNNNSIMFDANMSIDSDQPVLILMMIVRNEADNFLRNMLTHACSYADYMVIIDDASTDNTVKICKDILVNTPHKIIINQSCMFSVNEVKLRQQLFNETVQIINSLYQNRSTYILCLDADEIFEQSFATNIKSYLTPDFDLFYFRLYDMWNDTHYREDNYWTAHNMYRPFIIRYDSTISYVWNEVPLHCGRFPIHGLTLKNCCLPYRLKHYGWATPNIRTHKYLRYKKLDPKGIWGSTPQYESILDKNPILIPWNE